MFLVKNLCCLLDCKAFGGSRVKTRWCIMYLGGATCVFYTLVRPWVRRELRIEDVSCEELVLLLNCKAFGGSRVKARWCILYLEETCAIYFTCKPWGGTRVTTLTWFLWRTCVVYVIVKPSVGRGLRRDDVSCILVGRGLRFDDIPCILKKLAVLAYV